MELDHSQFAHRLVSGMPDAIVYADAEGVIRRWNRGATRIFGFTEAEALGRSLDIIIPEHLRERHRERNSQLLSLSEAAYEAGLQRIERDLDNPQTPKARADHLCFVTVRGNRG